MVSDTCIRRAYQGDHVWLEGEITKAPEGNEVMVGQTFKVCALCGLMRMGEKS